MRTPGAKNILPFAKRKELETSSSQDVKHLANIAGNPFGEFRGLLNHQDSFLDWIEERHDQTVEQKQRERAGGVEKRDRFLKYGDFARKVVAALLDTYAGDQVLGIEDPKIIRLDPLNHLGSPVELIRAFGGKGASVAAIYALADDLYSIAA